MKRSNCNYTFFPTFDLFIAPDLCMCVLRVESPSIRNTDDSYPPASSIYILDFYPLHLRSSAAAALFPVGFGVSEPRILMTWPFISGQNETGVGVTTNWQAKTNGQPVYEDLGPWLCLHKLFYYYIDLIYGPATWSVSLGLSVYWFN